MPENIFIYTLAVVVLFILPSVSIYKSREEVKKNPGTWGLLTRYSILLLLLFFSVKEQGIGTELIQLPSQKEISQFSLQVIASLLFVLGIDGLSLYYLVRKKIYILSMSDKPELRYSQSIHSISHKSKIALAVTCILSGIWEEVVFRGLLFFYLDRLNIPLSIIFILSSLLFAFNHFYAGKNQMIYSFFFGLVYCLIYALTKNLIAVITGHIAGNLFVFFVSIPLLKKKTNEFFMI